MEERVAQEALETLQLEKRLSLLSHSGWPGSAGRAMAWAVREGQRPWGRGCPFKATSQLLFVHSCPSLCWSIRSLTRDATLTKLRLGC